MALRLEDRFHGFTERTGTCWLWTGSMRSGYGQIEHNGKTIGAHRAAWIIYVGEIPEGLEVCHRCDNPRCVNPLHLFLGTGKDNQQDCNRKDRRMRHRRTRLTVELLKMIRYWHGRGRNSVFIAQRFGVSVRAVNYVLSGKRHKGVPA